ncbi:MAG: phage tail tape measure protein, partial [Oscillospiraceae bacterium]|nr:phage tail tape measure protein [Oscillospiraceae bacterium]
TELIKNCASGTVETGTTFEASMSKVKAISGATTSELKDLDAVARQYGRDTQFSASECADALTYMALAGWKVDDMIKALPGVLNLAAASEMDLAKASDVVTDYMTAFGWEANRAGEFADKMAFAMANSNTDTEMLGEAYKNCASTADSLHYSMEEVTAAIMTMANAGVKGGESGTALNAVMTRLATDTKGCASALSEYGVSIYDEEGNMQSLSSILTGISDIWSDLTDEQQANLAKIIAGQQQYSSFQTVMKGLSDTAKESGKSFEDYTEALLNCDGTASEMAETMTDNLQGDLKKMESAYQDLQLSIYNGVNKPLRDVVQTITENVLPAFSNLVEGVDGAEKEVSEAIGKLASVVLKKIKDLLPKVLPTLSKIIQQLVSKSISNIKNLGYMLANSIQTLASDIIPAFSRNFPKLIARISSLVKKNLPAIVNSLKRIIKNLTSAFKSVISDMIPGLLKTAAQLLMDGVPLIVSTFIELFGAIVDALPDVVESLETALLQIIDAITDFFSKEENLDKLKNTGKKLLEKIAVSMKENVGVFKNKIPDIMRKIRDELKNAVPKMASVADKIITNITDAFDVSDKWQDLKNSFSTIFAGVPENLEEKYRIFKETATESFDRIKKSAENLKNAVKNLFDRLRELLNIHAGDANDAVNAIVDIAGAIASISVDAVSRAVEAISDFLLWISGDSFGAETTRDAIIGIVTAIATFETLNGAITIIQNLPNLLSGLSGAFTGFWGVIAANPLLALISLLVGLIAVLGNVMKTSEEWQIGWQMIKDAWNGFIDSISEGYLIYEETFKKIKEKVTNFGESWKNFWEGYGAYLAEGIENFNEKIQAIPDKFQELINNAKKWGEDFLLNFVNGVSENINPLHNTFESLGEWIYDRFHFSTPDKGVLADSDTWFPDMMQNFANGIRENSVLVMDQLGNLANNMAEQSQNAGNRFLSGILNLTEKLPGNLGIHLSNTVNRVIDFGRNLHQKADSAASDMVNAIENRIRSLPDKMTEVGQNLVQGLWNGIQGMKNWVLSQISGFCNNILDSIFSTFDIHSPAKTTIYVGKMLDYGLAGGVTENQDEPIQAIRQMAHNLLNETAVIPERLPVQQTQFQASAMQNVANINTLSEKLDNILQAIENGQVIMLDSDKLVGGTANQMNAALGKIQLLASRR